MGIMNPSLLLPLSQLSACPCCPSTCPSKVPGFATGTSIAIDLCSYGTFKVSRKSDGNFSEIATTVSALSQLNWSVCSACFCVWCAILYLPYCIVNCVKQRMHFFRRELVDRRILYLLTVLKNTYFSPFFLLLCAQKSAEIRQYNGA